MALFHRLGLLRTHEVLGFQGFRGFRGDVLSEEGAATLVVMNDNILRVCLN